MLMYHSIPTTAPSFLLGLPSGLAKEKLKNNGDKESICFKLSTKYSRQFTYTEILLLGLFKRVLNIPFSFTDKQNSRITMYKTVRS